MITDHNLQISEQEYRDLDLPSYSLCSAIADQGVEAVNGVSTGFNLKFGSLVDDMCFEPSKLQNYYHSLNVKPPTGNPRKVVDIVLSGITAGVGDTNVSKGFLKVRKKKVTKDITDYVNEVKGAAATLGVYQNYTEEKLMQVIEGKAGAYFKEQLEARGKIFIKPDMWMKAEVAADTLKTHDFTKIYFEGADGLEIFYQYKFVQTVDGHKVKGMLDCLVVDHDQKAIFPVDLKTGENPGIVFDKTFLLHRYYLQAGLYRRALLEIVKNDPDLEGYTVANFEFVYLSKTNLYKPLIWVTPESMYQAAWDGFTDRFGFRHKGLTELLGLYADCKSGMYCEYSKEVFENDGRIMLDNLIQSTEYDEEMENRAEED